MNKLFTLAVLILGIVIGAMTIGAVTYPLIQQTDKITNSSAVNNEQQPLYWVAPMDDNYRRDKPGKSPMGMDLVPVYNKVSDALNDDSEVTISPAVENNLGVKIVDVMHSPLAAEIDAAGFIQFDEDRLHHIHVRTEGWIEKLYISTEGDRVQAGQKLFDLYSPELVNAQEDFASLLKSNNRKLIGAARSRLKALGISSRQIKELERTRTVQQYVAYYAHNDGFVSALHVRHGMFITPSTEIMAVGNTQQVWITAEIFERDISHLQPGLPVNIQVSAWPGEIWQGKIDYLYPELDDKTRSARIRVIIDNPDGRLQPNMFASIQIKAKSQQALIHIPRQALIQGGKGDRVVVALGNGRFSSRVVNAGAEYGNSVHIVEGLTATEQVVVSGQFLIDSESNIDMELDRLSNKNAGAMHHHE